MTCFNPKYVQYTYANKPIIKDGKPTGKSAITKIIKFQTKKKFKETEIGNGKMIIPCGRCLRLFIR